MNWIYLHWVWQLLMDFYWFRKKTVFYFLMNSSSVLLRNSIMLREARSIRLSRLLKIKTSFYWRLKPSYKFGILLKRPQKIWRVFRSANPASFSTWIGRLWLLASGYRSMILNYSEFRPFIILYYIHYINLKSK